MCDGKSNEVTIPTVLFPVSIITEKKCGVELLSAGEVTRTAATNGDHKWVG